MNRRHLSAAMLSAVLPVASVALAGGPTSWINPGSGLWHNAANWSAGIPGGAGDEAFLPAVITADATLTTSAAVGLGMLLFNSPNRYRITGSFPFTIADPTDTQVNVLAGSHRIDMPVSMATLGDLSPTLNISGGTGHLEFIGQVRATATATLVKTGDGRLDFNLGVTESGGPNGPSLDAQAGTWRIRGGQTKNINVAAGATLQVAFNTTDLWSNGAITIDGTLDLSTQSLFYDYTTPADAAGVKAELAAAYAGGNWNVGGLTSSDAAAAATVPSAKKTSLGYADLVDFGGASVEFPPGSGNFFDATTFVAIYTLAGDATFDRRVNINDFAALAANFNQTNTTWRRGDFTYDNVTDIADFSRLAANFNQQLPADGARGAVPEPAGLCLAAATMAFGLRRRRPETMRRR